MMIPSLPIADRHARRAADIGGGICLGLAAALAASAGARDASPEQPAMEAAASQATGSGFRASALSVIDGDTFEARVTLFPGQEIVTRIRLAGVDAPELHGRCQAETEAALEAKQELSGLVEGRPLTLTGLRGDKYFGRVLARVASADKQDVSEALIASGAGRRYSGGKRAGWC